MTRPKLNRMMVLERPERVPDGAGGFIQTWIAMGELWCALRARSGRETRGQEISLSRTGFRILVRAAPHGAPSRPEPEQRLRDGARIFRIRSVAEYDQAGRYLACFVDEEVVA